MLRASAWDEGKEDDAARMNVGTPEFLITNTCRYTQLLFSNPHKLHVRLSQAMFPGAGQVVPG
jgi:hypothetical protein